MQHLGRPLVLHTGATPRMAQSSPKKTWEGPRVGLGCARWCTNRPHLVHASMPLHCRLTLTAREVCPASTHGVMNETTRNLCQFVWIDCLARGGAIWGNVTLLLGLCRICGAALCSPVKRDFTNPFELLRILLYPFEFPTQVHPLKISAPLLSKKFQ